MSLRAIDDYRDYLISLAKQSNMKMKHAAIIVKSGKILGAGFNFHYSGKKIHGKISSHAEYSAIRDAIHSKNSIRDAILIVVRITPGGNLTNSMPCDRCGGLLLKHQLKSVLYSIKSEETPFVKMELVNHPNLQELLSPSSGTVYNSQNEN